MTGLSRLYPLAWRERYGEELEALIVEASGGGRVPLRTRADVALGAARERLRSAGLSGDGAPGERVRGGSLLVLCAWTLFVVAGMSVQKLSEHWQAATPPGSRSLPAGAFDGLVAAAAVGSVLVLAGIAAVAPTLLGFLRGGGWPSVRRRVLTAALVTLLAIAATVALVAWGHGLTDRQRNSSHLGAYGIYAAVWALLIVCCLASWTAAAVATARRLSLPAAILRLEARLGAAVAVCMAAMTAATALWWAALASAAPWFLADGPAGSTASPLAPALLVSALLMLVATLAATAGAARALAALAGLRAS